MFVPDIFVVFVTWVKITFKCAYGQEEVVQLADMSRGYGRHGGG